MKSMVCAGAVFILYRRGITRRAQVTYSAQEVARSAIHDWHVACRIFLTIGGVQNPRQVGITLWVDWRVPHICRRFWMGWELNLRAAI